MLPFLNPALATEEIEHQANNYQTDKEYIEEGEAGIPERSQRDVHSKDAGDYSNRQEDGSNNSQYSHDLIGAIASQRIIGIV